MMCTTDGVRANYGRHHFTKHVKREQKRNYLNDEKHNKKHEFFKKNTIFAIVHFYLMMYK